MLQVTHLTVKVGDKKILKDFSFDFQRGKIYAVMGPNGSGKSTLAHTMMGNPVYTVNGRSKMVFKGENITKLDATRRSEKGMFLSFQSPLSLSGVKLHQLLQFATNGKKDPLTLRRETVKIAKELRIKEELLTRSLNEGASGGEKKKLEVLQAAALERDFIIFDEVDTGVDVDALRTISTYLHKHRKGKTYILITHYNRILKYLKPDRVLVLVDGKLTKVGDKRLARTIEKNGYQGLSS